MTSPFSGHTLPDSADQGDLAFVLHGPICFILSQVSRSAHP